MHVFVDTNVLLDFYEFTNDDLDALNSIFVSHKKGAAVVHLTDQVRDEFNRNREARIGRALKQFKDYALSQLPSFMKAYPEYEKLQKASEAFKKQHAALLARAEDDITSRKLAADGLIGAMFKKSKLLKTTSAIVAQARLRMEIGNPPGKDESLGDAINWLLLLRHVPKNQPLYILTSDSDYYSSIDKGQMSGFLLDEWKERKKSTVQCYKTIRDFLKDHYDGVVLSLDPEKKALIGELENTGTFAGTHAVVARLAEFDYFSFHEAIALLDAALYNNQFGWIITDPDVLDLMRRAVMPHRKKIKDARYREMLGKISGNA